jgi:sporulation protein YlmC with PRC-barrel domain
MEPGRYDNPDQSQTTTVGTSLGADGIPIEGTASGDVRRASREPLLGEDNYWNRKTGPGPRVMAADTLEGDDIVNTANEKLGKLEHIMIDVPTGRVAYGVLSFGGFLGMGDKLFAIPWHALRIDPPNHRFILEVDKETLKNAPGFDKDQWPSMADEQWAREVHAYYHARPYWD